MSARQPIEPLDDAALAEALDALPAWTHEEDVAALTRTFSFPDFSRAFAFMTRVAMLAERDDHHPEWTNIYGTVIVRLTTHECDGISERDVKMARAMDRMVTDPAA